MVDSTKKYISTNELKTHNKKGDIWISIQGKIYDISMWVDSHPGGEHPLLILAGQDVTDVFIAFHPGSAWHELDKFFSGFHLKDYKCGWIGHDSSHYQTMASPRYNRLAQLLSANCLLGVSTAYWKWNHNAHHIACNSLEFDPDIQHVPVFAVSTEFFRSLTSKFYDRKMSFDRVSRFLVSYQHWTFYPVLCFSRIHLWVQSAIMLLSKRDVPDRGVEILSVLVFWVWYPLLVSRLPNWGERIAFLVVSFAVVGIQQLQFSLNHFSTSVYLGAPSGNDWFEKQTSGSLDISCPSWMDWFHGGLQFQIEHHLFPRLPRNQLRKISTFVKQLCATHNLSYNCASFSKANAMTIQTLHAAALKARDLTNPVPKNLVWEAVNTLG
ncbi:hypothetical protein Droror1_Dr00003550 [Drosera rotundifolia]